MKIIIILSIVLITSNKHSFAQPTDKKISQKISLDSLRKKEAHLKKYREYNSKQIRYTLIGLSPDSANLTPLDTTLQSFQNYSPLSQPQHPTIGLGGIGLAYRELLFNPPKTIGFDAGFHSLDAYLLPVDSIRYYRARSPYTELYYVDGRDIEDVFKVIHSQNIRPNWNFGGNYHIIGADGLYDNQDANHLNAALFSWFESRNKRYKIFGTAVFNTLKAAENGSIINDHIFTSAAAENPKAEQVRLFRKSQNLARQIWKEQTLFLKQSYTIGKLDGIGNKFSSRRHDFSYTSSYTTNQYQFYCNQEDYYDAFPAISDATTLTNDSTQVQNFKNEFLYSVYRGGQSTEKLSIGLQYDWYDYKVLGYASRFSNLTAKGEIGYPLNNKVVMKMEGQHIIVGEHFGDYLYQVKSPLVLGDKAGQIVLGAYVQCKSPAQLFEFVNYRFHQWKYTFDKTRVNNLSFFYRNPRFNFSFKAEGFLVSNYLYYKETGLNQIKPNQFDKDIGILKLSLTKNFNLWRFSLDNFLVYQQSNHQDLLRIPEVYAYNSFYYRDRFWKVYTHIGFDVRYHTPFATQSYAINVGQFYNNTEPVVFESFPVIDFWIKASMRRANLFLKVDYINQGLFSDGYYTVNRYPMQDRGLKLGISWKFYD